jgi:uncharacterized protein HemX
MLRGLTVAALALGLAGWGAGATKKPAVRKSVTAAAKKTKKKTVASKRRAVAPKPPVVSAKVKEAS